MKKKDVMNAFLGEDTDFDGKLTFRGTIRIDGRFKGDITDGGTLIVGEAGVIEANIHVSSIVLSGEVHGNIQADERVEIHAPGKIYGDIQSPTVVIHEGVVFDGNCRTNQTNDMDTGPLSIISSENSE